MNNPTDDSLAAANLYVAATMALSDDPQARQSGIVEIARMCSEEIDHPLPYDILSDAMIAAGALDHWSSIMHYIIQYSRLPDPLGSESKDHKYCHASNKCRTLGKLLQDAGQSGEATQCFMWAARFAYSVVDDHSTLEAPWNIPIAEAYKSAEQADGEPRGDLFNEVHELSTELLDD